MECSFDQRMDRLQTQSVKWRQYGEDVLPLWVADMDFRCPEPIVRALHTRVDHGIFGYEGPSDELRTAIVERLYRLYGWQVLEDAIVFVPGVVVGFNVAINATVGPREAMLIQTPVYPPILGAGDTLGTAVQHAPLTRNADGSYNIDVDRFRASANDRTRLFLLCNPHNPVGRVFRLDELKALGEICLQRDMIICSDEIHGDLVFKGHPHVPIASLAPEIAKRTITLMAPSKTFNIPGLHCAFAVIPDPVLRRTYNHARRGLVGAPNLLGYTAALAAYTECESWLDALLAYLEGNRDFLMRTLSQTMPDLHMAAPEGTYLAWIDCRDADLPSDPYTFFLEEGGVALNDGRTFGPGGDGFVRLNFGCPRSLLAEALDRMGAAMRRR